jgi:hypothetical protein
MRAIVLALAFVAFPVFADPLNPSALEVDMVGELWGQGYRDLPGGAKGAFTYRVSEVVNDGRMIASVTPSTYSGGERSRDGKVFYVVFDVPTKGLADGKIYKPVGEYKVTGTTKIGGRTYFVLASNMTKK